jgi:hypothetical protein
MLVLNANYSRRKCHHTNDKGEFDCNKSGTNFYLRSDDGKALPGATANGMCGEHRLPGQRGKCWKRSQTVKRTHLNLPQRAKTANRVVPKNLLYSICRHTNDQGEFDCSKCGYFFLRSDDGKALPGATANRRCGEHRLPGQRHHGNMFTSRKIVENPGPRIINKCHQCRHFFTNGEQCKLSGTFYKRNSDGSSLSKHEFSKRRCSEHRLAGQVSRKQAIHAH